MILQISNDEHEPKIQGGPWNVADSYQYFETLKNDLTADVKICDLKLYESKYQKTVCQFVFKFYKKIENGQFIDQIPINDE